MTRREKLAVAVLVVAGTWCVLSALRSSSAEAASPAGISLARDWALDEATAQPVGGYITYGQGDRRYCKLTGCTMTGALNGTVFRTTSTGVTGAIFGYTGSTTTGIGFNTGSFSTLVYANGSVNWTFNGGTGALDNLGAFNSTANAAAAVKMAGTSWLESAGDTSANIDTRVPTAGGGALIYDDTNSVWRSYENTTWRYPLSGTRAPGASSRFIWTRVNDYFRTGVSPEATNYTRNGKNISSALGYWCTPTFASYNITCWWETTGSGGSTGVVMEISDGTTTQNVTLGACNTAAFTTLSVAGGSGSNLLVGDLTLQMKNTTDCGTNPAGVHCAVDMACSF